MPEFATREYKLSAAKYAKRRGQELAARWWWLILAPILALLIVGTHDWRFFIVALAFVLIIIPTILLIVFYYYAMSVEAVRFIMPQRCIITDNGLRVEYLSVSEGAKPLPSQTIDRWEIKKISVDGEFLSVVTNDGMIEIPLDVFPSNVLLYDDYNAGGWTFSNWK